MQLQQDFWRRSWRTLNRSWKRRLRCWRRCQRRWRRWSRCWRRSSRRWRRSNDGSSPPSPPSPPRPFLKALASWSWSNAYKYLSALKLHHLRIKKETCSVVFLPVPLLQQMKKWSILQELNWTQDTRIELHWTEDTRIELNWTQDTLCRPTSVMLRSGSSGRSRPCWGSRTAWWVRHEREQQGHLRTSDDRGEHYWSSSAFFGNLPLPWSTLITRLLVSIHWLPMEEVDLQGDGIQIGQTRRQSWRWWTCCLPGQTASFGLLSSKGVKFTSAVVRKGTFPSCVVVCLLHLPALRRYWGFLDFLMLDFSICLFIFPYQLLSYFSLANIITLSSYDDIDQCQRELQTEE